MATTTKKKGKPAHDEAIDVARLDFEEIEVCILGTSPFICNAMSQKVKRDLVGGSVKKNKMERETTLKHDPLAEYRRSMYRSRGANHPTRIIFPGGGFKKAISSAALDIPGAKKAQIGRLCQVVDWDIPVFGVPEMMMSAVIMAGPSGAPDVRTRAVIPEWAMVTRVRYTRPNLTAQTMANLIAAAGMIIGLGDWRAQKGAGAFGCFQLVSADDEDFQRIVAAGGVVAQDAAIHSPECFDSETDELWEWFQVEMNRRGFKLTA